MKRIILVGIYLLHWVFYWDNNEIAQLLMEYDNQHQIILELNYKNKNGQYPLYWDIRNNSNEIIQLLIEYAWQNQIILKYEKWHIENKPEIQNLLQKLWKRKR